MKFRYLTAILWALAPLLATVVSSPQLCAQSEKEAIKTFRRDFKPKAKAIESKKDSLVVRADSGIYLREKVRQKDLLELWTKAAQGLKGHDSQAVAKLIAESWPRLEKEIESLAKRHAKTKGKIASDYAKFLKSNGGKGVLPGKPFPNAKVAAAYNKYFLVVRESSELQRALTDLESLQDELHQVVVAMNESDGLRWLLENALGQKSAGLALKVAAIRRATEIGETMLPDLVKALKGTKRADVITAALFGIGVFGEKAKSSAPLILPLLTHGDAGVRERAALALQHMKIPESIEPMMRLLASESGQARMRIIGALEILTGQQFGGNISAWQAWFAKEGADYTSGKKPLGMGRPSEHRKFDQKNYYYGIPQHGKGIVYVIDCSGSMIVDKDKPKWGDPDQQRLPEPAKDLSNSRSEASKRELVRALSTLNSDQKFNIIWYNHTASLFKKSMVVAKPKNLEVAKEFVRKLPADSSTNIYDAMKLAFTQTGRGSYDKYYGVEFDTIFLLTDGKPTLQGVGDDDPNKIIEGVRKWNPLNRVTVHTIAMGDSGIDHKFMRTLAKENGGEYRKILAGGKVVRDGDEEEKPKKGKDK